MIKSKKHAWHGEEFYQMTGSYENCNPQYWDYKECAAYGGSVHNESREKMLSGISYFPKKEERHGCI